MKSLLKKFSLRAAALTLGLLGHTTAQAQIGGMPLWTNSPSGGHFSAVDGSGNVFVAGQIYPGLVMTKYSGAGVPLWTNGGPANGAAAVAVDGNSNVFVTGNLFSGGCATIAYSGAGVLLWEHRDNIAASAMAVDGNGNVLVTGQSGGGYGTIKYSGAGVSLWTNLYNGPGNSDVPYALAVDGSGNVFVTGSSYGTTGNPDYATIKYSAAGAALWTNRYNGPGNSIDGANAVAVDANGNVFVSGTSIGIGGYFEYATVAYSTAGVPLWTNRSNAGSATALAVDSSGSVFATGYSSNDYATIKYSGAGVALWTNRYARGLSTGNDLAAALAVDGSGNVFIAGPEYGTDNSHYHTTIAYSSAGVPLWTNRFYMKTEWSAPNSTASSVVVDGFGNVFVTGSIWSSVSVSPGHSVIIKYSSAIPPSLTIARTATNTVALSWPSPSLGFTLQQNANSLATVNWTNVVATPSDDGTTRTVIVDPPTGNRFYRLVH